MTRPMATGDLPWDRRFHPYRHSHVYRSADKNARSFKQSSIHYYTQPSCRYIRSIIIIILYYFFFVFARLTWSPPQVENGPGSRRTTAAAAMYTRAHNIIIIPIVLLYGHAFIGDYRSTNCNGSNMHLYRYNNNNK
uniref:Uncharacterized protein n=1 Tax=Schizaphis graminum TaxID=13262 RepID=A0A2S2PL26_SCHGA